MTPAELKQKKRDCELAITQAVSSIVESFVDSTGFSVTSVSVDVFDVTDMGSDGKQYKVLNASISLDI